MSTLAVERHSGVLYLCLVDTQSSQLLARFSSPEAAEAFKRAQRDVILAARAAGESGL